LFITPPYPSVNGSTIKNDTEKLKIMINANYHINRVPVKLPPALLTAGLSTKQHNLLSFYLKLKSIRENSFLLNSSNKELQMVLNISRSSFFASVQSLVKQGWLRKENNGYRLASYEEVYTSLNIAFNRSKAIVVSDISNYNQTLVKELLKLESRKTKTAFTKGKKDSGAEISASVSISYFTKCLGFKRDKVYKLINELKSSHLKVRKNLKVVERMTLIDFELSGYNGDFRYQYNNGNVVETLPNVYTLSLGTARAQRSVDASVEKKIEPIASNEVVKDIERRFENFLNDYRLDLVNSKIISVYYSSRKIPSRMYSNIIRKVLKGSLKFFLDGYINIDHEIEKEYVEVESNRFNANLFNSLPKDVSGNRAYMVKYALGIADEEQQAMTLYPANWNEVVGGEKPILFKRNPNAIDITSLLKKQEQKRIQERKAILAQRMLALEQAMRAITFER
jgi:hypothetical protein